MIDFHSHILPNIDDGSRGIDETFNLIQEAKNVGFSAIISTSHYLENEYIVEEQARKVCLNAIEKELEQKQINLKLYLGSEIYVSYNMLDLINDKKASTINESRYVLFELPFNREFENLKNVIFKLINNGFKPIIAHPERYEYVQKDPNIAFNLVNMGVLFQGNYGSLIGTYGKKAKNTITLLLKNNLIHFLGTDAHRENTIYPKIPETLEKLETVISKEEIEELTTINPKMVIENKNIDIRRPIKIKQSFFNKLAR